MLTSKLHVNTNTSLFSSCVHIEASHITVVSAAVSHSTAVSSC